MPWSWYRGAAAGYQGLLVPGASEGLLRWFWLSGCQDGCPVDWIDWMTARMAVQFTGLIEWQPGWLSSLLVWLNDSQDGCPVYWFDWEGARMASSSNGLSLVFPENKNISFQGASQIICVCFFCKKTLILMGKGHERMHFFWKPQFLMSSGSCIYFVEVTFWIGHLGEDPWKIIFSFSGDTENNPFEEPAILAVIQSNQ